MMTDRSYFQMGTLVTTNKAPKAGQVPTTKA